MAKNDIDCFPGCFIKNIEKEFEIFDNPDNICKEGHLQQFQFKCVTWITKNEPQVLEEYIISRDAYSPNLRVFAENVTHNIELGGSLKGKLALHPF